MLKVHFYSRTKSPAPHNVEGCQEHSAVFFLRSSTQQSSEAPFLWVSSVFVRGLVH